MSVICLDSWDWALVVSSVMPSFSASSLIDWVSAMRNGLASFSDWEKPTVLPLRSSSLAPYFFAVQVPPFSPGDLLRRGLRSRSSRLPLLVPSSLFAQAPRVQARARPAPAARVRLRSVWVMVLLFEVGRRGDMRSEAGQSTPSDRCDGQHNATSSIDCQVCDACRYLCCYGIGTSAGRRGRPSARRGAPPGHQPVPGDQVPRRCGRVGDAVGEALQRQPARSPPCRGRRCSARARSSARPRCRRSRRPRRPPAPAVPGRRASAWRRARARR